MRAVFADSFHFLALLNQNDPAHAKAATLHRFRWNKILTTDCVLLELGDALCDPRDHDDFLRLLEALRSDPRVSVVHLTQPLLERGIELFRSRPDKDWPLTDCISFVVMQENGVREALTGDQHFTQAGLIALLAAP
jgi:uncharacterized protein